MCHGLWGALCLRLSGFMGCICRADISSRSWKQLLTDAGLRLPPCSERAVAQPGARLLQSLGGHCAAAPLLPGHGEVTCPVSGQDLCTVS